jgi:menaquinone-specific isochorismate synthase
VTSAPALALLTATTVRVEDPGPLLDLLPEDGALAWVTRGEGLVGWGEAARFDLDPSRAAEPDRFELAEQWWQALTAASDVSDDVRLPGTGLVAFGSFAFDGDRASSVLVVPEVVVGCRGGTWWTTRISGDGGRPAARRRTPVRAPGAVRFADGSRSSAGWTSVVADAVDRVVAGEVAKVVLARDLEARTEQPLDVRWPLRRLAADYPECRTFSVDGLFGATPEVYVRLERGVATSRVLAGTIRRSGDSARDVEQASSLARSSKDLEEHEYAVRSVADALAPHCDTVDVPDEPFVLHLANVMHLATDVRATVADGASSLALVASLHPSAAVCGTPTAAATAVIRELEGLDRGRYAGPVGWTGADGDGEWGIALRCAEVDPDDPRRLRLFAGCGIVAGSLPEQELAESAAKLVPVRDALQA